MSSQPPMATTGGAPASHVAAGISATPTSPARAQTASAGTGFGSGSPATPTYAAPTTRPPPPAMHSNPKIAEMQTMFPSVDVGVIEIVLESTGGSQDRAIEQLLSITDENFKAEEEVPGYRREAEQQVDLDEEFARSLQLEDEQSARQYQNTGYTGGQSGHTNPGAGGLPYQARVRRDRSDQPQQQAQGPRDTYGTGAYNADRYGSAADGPPQGAGMGMLQVEEKLQKAAEAGKQTFNNLFSLAKSKYAEFQQNQAQSSQGQGQQGGGLWGGEQQQHQQQQQQQGSAAGWGRANSGSGTGAGARGGVQNYGYGQQAQGQGYGARGGSDRASSRSESFSSESTNDLPSDPRPVIRPSANRWNPNDVYDDPLPAGRSTPTGTRGIALNAGGRQSPGAGGGVGSPENRGMTKIDASKLGILPKKKVDLLSSSPNSNSTPPVQPNLLDEHDSDPNPGIPGASHSVISKIPPTPPGRAKGTFELEDSDDELEYTKNPFDEK